MSAVPPPGPRVLVVEDDRDVADVLARLLECWGYEPLVTHDGPAALAVVAAGAAPAAALLDIGLPGMSGFELARRLRGQPGLGECLLIALTGYAGEEVVQGCFEAGIDLYMVKTSAPQQLHKILDGRLPTPRP
jgi:CheY-like chemotaxis protein